MKSYVNDPLDYFVILIVAAPRENSFIKSLGNELVKKLEKITSHIVLCQTILTLHKSLRICHQCASDRH